MAPVNNVGHSMWDAVRLTINDRDITQNGGLYPYKSYISNVLSYDTWVKNCQLTTSGWYQDSSTHMEGEEGNDGFKQRNLLFREDFDETKPYRKDGATFYTRINHDLISCESGLPPSTKVKLELDRIKDSFVILKSSTDQDEYKLKLNYIALYMPIANLSQNVFLEINSYLTKDKPVKILYRNVEVRPITIPKNNHLFYSEYLFTENVPARIVVCFVETEAKSGNFEKNPFNFRRRWTVKSGSSTEEIQDPTEKRLKEVEHTNKILLNKLDLLTTHLFQITQNPEKTVKGKGRGKSSRLKNVAQPVASTSSQQFEEFGEDNSSLMTDDESVTENRINATEEVYIKKLSLTINGNPIDGVEDHQTLGHINDPF